MLRPEIEEFAGECGIGLGETPPCQMRSAPAREANVRRRAGRYSLPERRLVDQIGLKLGPKRNVSKITGSDVRGRGDVISRCLQSPRATELSRGLTAPAVRGRRSGVEPKPLI